MKLKLSRVLLSVAVIIIGLLVVNCASIIHGTMQEVRITSTPEQATVEIKTAGGMDIFSGTTPVFTKLQRKNAYTVDVNLEGYQTQTMIINKEFDAIALGNLLCGGIIGFIIDATNGAMYKLEPNMIHVELITASTNDGATEIYAVFHAMNSDGELQTVVVPMIKE